MIAFVDPGMRLAPFLCMAVRRLPESVGAVFLAGRPKSRSILIKSGQRVYPAERHPQGHPSVEDLKLDRDQLLAGLRLPRDRDAVAQDTAHFRRVVAAVHAFLVDSAPRGVFCWNGSGLAAGVAAQLARARGIPVAYGENGYLPGTMQLDPLGVNAAASFGAAHISLSQVLEREWTEAQYRELQAVLDTYRRGGKLQPEQRRPRKLRASALAYLQQGLIDLRTRQPNMKGNRLVPEHPPALPERFVFFPLQVRQDSQLTVHSPVYGNGLDQAVDDLSSALAARAPDTRLVVKLHPADRRKTDYDAVIRRHPDVVWIGSGDVRDILRRSSAVVTVNSTVGVEALVFDKPVVVLGNAAYGFDGLVHPISARDQLADALSAALSTPPDADITMRYLAFLYFEAFTRAHLDDYGPRSLGAFCERLLRVLKLDGETAAATR